MKPRRFLSTPEHSSSSLAHNRSLHSMQLASDANLALKQLNLHFRTEHWVNLVQQDRQSSEKPILFRRHLSTPPTNALHEQVPM
mmetsp:Transcript_2627/g.4502  ORF Transcript_2627/g.4502 Transcript_2627/m.4502 type:complete len:84 (-) Transcript_2627:264-515(-)